MGGIFVSEYKRGVAADNLKAQGREDFVGGTGLYQRIALPHNFGGVQGQRAQSIAAEEWINSAKITCTIRCGIDKTAAEKMHPNNTRRVIARLR